MTSEPQTDYKALVEKLQSDIEGLKTQLFYLVNTKIEFTHTELEATRLELKQTKIQLNEVLTEQFVGTVSAFAMPEPPAGWFECDGQTVSRVDYARLFSKIGTTFGEGDKETTFNLPNLKGVFVRGWERVVDGHDSERKFGAYQDDQVQTHSHNDSGHSHSGSTGYEGSHYHSASTESTGSHSHSGSTSENGYHAHKFGEYEGENFKVTGFYPTKNVDSSRSAGYVGKILLGYSTIDATCWRVEGYPDYNTYTGYDGSHSHSFSTSSAGSHSHSVNVSSAGSHSHSVSINNGHAHLSDPINARHGNETRPKNVALLFCIKY